MAKQIIHADDEKAIRKLIGKFINQEFPDYELISLEDGDQLKSALDGMVHDRSTLANLVITDNGMPGYSGGELIQEYASKLNVPMILFYAGTKEIGQYAMRDGAFGYILKPGELETIRSMIEGALQE